MCEILVMFKTDGTTIKKKELSRFLYRALIASGANKDGYGVMCEKFYMRDKEKMTENDVKHILDIYKEDSRFFAVHVRFATCEVIEEYTHPFPYPSFLAMHNGVVRVDDKKSGSDSMDLFDAVNDAFKDDKTTFYDALKSALKTVSGTYSILSYVKRENALYYVRNNPQFDFMFVPKNNTVYGATKEERIKPLDVKELGFFETALFSRPLSNAVYRIDLNDGRFKRVGTVEEKQTFIWQCENEKSDADETKKPKWGWRRNQTDLSGYGNVYGSDW